MRNALGVEIKKGHWIIGRDFEGRIAEGRVVELKRGPHYPRAVLDSGVEIAANEVLQSLGPMTIGRGGVVKQNPDAIHIDIDSHNTKGRNVRAKNPLTRIKRKEITTKRSQASGHPAPSARLVKRRKRTAETPISGVYANPLSRVRVGSDSQRPHRNEAGQYTKKPTKRLKRRREYTDSLPAGFYANPRKLPDFKFVGVENDGGFTYGVDAVTPVTFRFLTRDMQRGFYAVWQLPSDVIKSPHFQSWARGLVGHGVIAAKNELVRTIKQIAGVGK